MAERYLPDIHIGLTDEQVNRRINDNLVNKSKNTTTKSIKAIVLINIFTIFNLLNLALALAILYVKSYRNLLFMGIVICNTLISIIQEIRSKIAVDKLSVTYQSKVCVIRNGTEKEIPVNELVLDDITKIYAGNQIVADCIIKDGEVEVNESFITGEADTVFKTKGDTILSGSFIVSGNCIAQIEHVAQDNFTEKIGLEAKQIKAAKSEIMISLNKVIKTISWFILPIGALLFYNQVHVMQDSFENATIQTVAALIGMIPEGLILLTSTVLAVSVVRLSKYKVLVQELYCIETLARVDLLCLDKTGTITTGKMQVKEIVPINADTNEIKEAVMQIISATKDKNGTAEAIKEEFGETKLEYWSIDKVFAFSSQKKYSGASFKGKGTFILGAIEFIDANNEYINLVKKYSTESRVLALFHSNSKISDGKLPEDIKILRTYFNTRCCKRRRKRDS